MTSQDQMVPRDGLLSQARDAMSRSEWQQARGLYTTAIEQGETAPAWEGLAEAAWWLHDEQATFHARERAFLLFREQHDRPSAARMATLLAGDSLDFRGELAVANGWFQLAHRLLDELPISVEHGWLSMWEGSVALSTRNDAAFARDAGNKAVAIGRALEDRNLEQLGLALEGLALVSEGDVQEGMRRLDEATAAALAGEFTDLVAMVTTFCYVIGACDRVRDYDRALQWCTRARAIFEQKGVTAFFSVCTPKYATVLMWRGAWDEAEHELRRSTEQMASIRPPMVGEGLARLGQLLWRRGKDEEAHALFRRAESEGLVLLGRAEAAFDCGDVPAAVDLAERYLRRVPYEDRLERVAGLELLVRARCALPDIEQAQTACQEMEETAQNVATLPLLAAARFARGHISIAQRDFPAAQRHFEDALDLYGRSGAVFEVARARSALASALYALGKPSAALKDAHAALEVFAELGAVRESDRILALMGSMAAKPASDRARADGFGLSPREVGVLRLVSLGRNNEEIAVELFLSIRTVERHISTIYEKLGVSGKAARAAATAYAFSHGIATDTSP